MAKTTASQAPDRDAGAQAVAGVARDAAESAADVMDKTARAPGAPTSTTGHVKVDAGNTTSGTTVVHDTGKGVISSAATFAADTVMGAASFATGAAVTGVELGVGVGATVLDAAGNVVRSGVETVRSIQGRGHEATTGTIETVRQTLAALDHRGHDVIGQANHSAARTAVEASRIGSRGINAAAETAGSLSFKAREVGSQAIDVTKEKTGEATNRLTGAADDAKKKVKSAVRYVEEEGERVAEKGMGMVDSAIGKTADASGAVAETMKDTARRAQQQGERAAEGAVGVGHAAAEKAAEKVSDAKETGKECAQYTQDKCSRAVQHTEGKSGSGGGLQTGSDGRTGSATPVAPEKTTTAAPSRARAEAIVTTTLPSHDSATDLSSKDEGVAADAAPNLPSPSGVVADAKRHFQAGQERELEKQRREVH